MTTPPADQAGYVERLGAALSQSGFPRLPARVFAALMVDEDGRMTSGEISAVLQVSAASVSTAVRYLQQVQLIHREREPGSRRDVYVVAQDAFHDVMINNSTIYATLRAVLAQGVPIAGGLGTSAGDRLGLSVEFLTFMETEIVALAGRWEQRRLELEAGGAPRG